MTLLLQGELHTEDFRLKEICAEVAKRLMTKEAGSGTEIWRSVFAENRKRLTLNSEEAEIIENAGSAFFGKSQDENKKHLEVLLERLDFQIELVRREKKNKQKVYGTLSVFCGFMLVIFLV
jgi:stage III sporulation protein AB